MSARADKGVLLCYDGSQRAGEAIRRAGRLLGPRPAVALHVWQAEAATANGCPSVADRDLSRLEERRRSAESAAAAGAAVAAEAGFEVQPATVRAGSSVAEAILQAVETHDPAVVVLGSRGLSDLASALLGSVSTSVVHDCSRPVLVIPPERR